MLIECNGEKCTGCGICSTVCPAKAIAVDGTAEVNDELCIQCFCCIELCPNGSLTAIRTVDP
jgi:ferredoxin